MAIDALATTPSTFLGHAADEVHETKNVGEACAASVTFQFNEPCPGTAC